MRYLMLLLLTASLAPAAPVPWRAVWEWSCPKRTDADLVRLADSAQALGFNVIMMWPPQQRVGFMADLCHQRGMKLYLSTVFAGGDKSWRQVVTAEEKERAAAPVGAAYMHGGEPVVAGEVFNTPLPCYARPEVIEYFRQKVIANAKLPADGLALDYVGYENYDRCYCPVCEQKMAEISAKPAQKMLPDVAILPPKLVRSPSALASEQILVDFTNQMAAAARATNPKLDLTIHIYPWFSPDPYWGHRTDVNFVGQTVAWFFRPHWPLEKVRERTANLIRDQRKAYPTHRAAPFIGFDATKPRNYRSARRVAEEIRVVQASGAEALQVAELGYLLRKPLVAEAVARELGGTYRAPARRTPAP